jgi:tetratricopeptide (TPR) repeat protein
MHTDACQATRVRGEQSEEVMQLRMECLDHRREELRALTDVLAQADPQVVQRAVGSATNLSGLDECRNTEALRSVVRPPAGPAQSRVAALRTRLADVKAHRVAGQYKEALALVVPAVEDARGLAYAPLLAESLSERGQAEWRIGKAEAAVDTLIEAAAAAEAGRYDHELAFDLTEIVYVLSEKLGRFADARRYGVLARATLTRAGADPKLEVRLDAHLVTILVGQGKWDEALAAYKSIVARRKEVHGQNAPEVGVTLVGMADVCFKKGDYDQAIEYSGQAIANLQHSYGPDHPVIAYAWNDRGAAFEGKADWNAALSCYEKALAIREAALGANHPDVAEALMNIGSARSHQGRLDEALALFERGQAIESKALGPDHLWVGHSEMNIADVLLGLGRFDEALEHATHSLAIRERMLDAQHPDLALSLSLVARVRVERHEEAKALPLLERAIPILERAALEPGLTAARFALARALWSLGHDRARARSLALAAREHAQEGRAEIDAWLAQHR